MSNPVVTAFTAAVKQFAHNHELRPLLGDQKSAVRYDIGHTSLEIDAMMVSPVVVFFKTLFNQVQSSSAYQGQQAKT